MPILTAPTIDQWNALSARVGGGLFKDAEKLEAMRSVDRANPDLSWSDFCDCVADKIAKVECNQGVVKS